MADPISIGTVAAIGMGATAAGGGVKAFGDIFTGYGKSAMDQYQAQIAEMNAVIARQNANFAQAAGYIEAQQSGYRTADEVARTRVGFAAGNIDTRTGSAAGVISSEYAIGAQNRSIILANAAKRAYGFQVAAAEDDAQASVYHMASKYDKTAGFINAGATVLGTIGQEASMRIAGSKAGSGIFQSTST